MNKLPVAVIGAGPVGLAAAAHLHAYQQPFVVLEAGDERGCRDSGMGPRAHVLAVAIHGR